MPSTPHKYTGQSVLLAAGGDSVTGLQVAGECLSGTWTWGHGLFLCLADVSHCKLSA